MECAFEMPESDVIACEGGDRVDETATAITGEAMRVVRVWMLTERTVDADRMRDECVFAPRAGLSETNLGAGVAERTALQCLLAHTSPPSS